MLRYLGMTTLCDLTFVVFLLSWLITRHVFFILVIKATWEGKDIIPRIWDRSRSHYMTEQIYFVFFAMLVSLQVGTTFNRPTAVADIVPDRLSNSSGSG